MGLLFSFPPNTWVVHCPCSPLSTCLLPVGLTLRAAAEGLGRAAAEGLGSLPEGIGGGGSTGDFSMGEPPGSPGPADRDPSARLEHPSGRRSRKSHIKSREANA